MTIRRYHQFPKFSDSLVWVNSDDLGGAVLYGSHIGKECYAQDIGFGWDNMGDIKQVAQRATIAHLRTSIFKKFSSK